MNNEILVSIFCITYNHKDNIAKAIEGFLSQRTTFGYEILIHDDASTDGTTEILKEYESRGIENLHIFFEEENQYSQKTLNSKLRDMYKSAKGKYHAICEGDDYWIDINKLQIQVDYMEKHLDCIMTAHNGLWVDNATHNISPANGFDRERDLTIEDIIRHKRGCFPTASIVLREEYHVVQEPFRTPSVGDWPLQFFCIDNGKIHYFDRIMSVYNMNFPGSWTDKHKAYKIGTISHNLEMISYLKRLDEYWEGKYRHEFENAIDAYIQEIMHILHENYSDDMYYLEKAHEMAGGKYAEACHLVRKKVDEVGDEKKRIKAFSDKFDYTLIMGCGKIAGELFFQLQEMGIEVSGFVISNNQKAPLEYHEKKVWRMDEIPFDKQNVGVLIGIQKAIKTEVLQSLEINRIHNYYWPSI